MADDVEDAIRAKTDAFAKRLSQLLRKAALEEAAAALAPSARTRTASSRATAGRGRRNRSATAQRAPGQKRTAAELARVTDFLTEYIKAHPGSRMEAMVKALGMARNDLVYPIKRLLAAKKIRSKGQKRATEYFPAG